MDNLFKSQSFHHSDSHLFEINDENLTNIVVSTESDSLTTIEPSRSGYEDSRWIEKSKSIKSRDNYTCQCCHAFNPMAAGMLFIRQGDFETYHHYEADKGLYEIHVPEYHMTINFDFYSGYRLTMPRLNVHHKLYINKRNLWEYNDDCLVTLCNNCHHYIHSLNDFDVPIFDETIDGALIPIGKLPTKPLKTNFDNTDLGTFRPLSLVREIRYEYELKGNNVSKFRQAKINNKKWYEYHDILDNRVVHISSFVHYDPRINKNTPEETNKVRDYIIYNFIEEILGFKKIK